MKEYDKEDDIKEKEENEENEDKKEKREKIIKEEKDKKGKKEEIDKIKQNNLSQNLSDSISKDKILKEEEIKRNFEFYNQRLKNNKDLYSDPQNMNKFLSQRHLYEHKKEKKDPLIDITNKNLQLEYISEIKNLMIKYIFVIILSILIFIKACLIIHNYKNYNEVLLAQIFSAFEFFVSIFLIVEAYRQALRDQLRSILFRIFSLFSTIFSLCLYIYELMNSYVIYHKIQIRKEKCRKNIKFCGDANINNIILGMSFIILIGIIYLSFFTFFIGYRSIKILLGLDFEVYQKQLLENEKINKKDKKEEKGKSDDSKNNKKEHNKNNNKAHLKSE